MRFKVTDKNLSRVVHAGRVANSRNWHGCQEAERTPPGIQDSIEEADEATEAGRGPVGPCQCVSLKSRGKPLEGGKQERDKNSCC